MRPTWDDYFLKICDEIATRATCDRLHVGSVATRDRRILASGYNGSPPRTPHCIDPVVFWECPRCSKVFTLKRKFCNICLPETELREKHGGCQLDNNHCQRVVHAEVNVVAQAARYGIALDGCTLYCNVKPCYNCLKIILSAGIQEIVWRDLYGTPDPRVEDMICETSVIFRQVAQKT